MRLVADGMRVRPGRRDQEIQRLHTSVAGAFGHDVEQFSVGLRMQLVENDAVDIKSVLAVRFRRQNLIERIRRGIYDALCRGEDLDPLVQRRAHAHHIGCHFKNDGSLLPVGCAAVNLGAFLTVAAAQKKRHGGGKFGFAHLFRNLDVCGIELTVTVRL